jgi:4-hydroxybenzoate polyprenyltransferase
MWKGKESPPTLQLERPTAAPGAKRLPEELIRATRPAQWVKNLVVLAAPVFAMRFDARSVALAAGAVVGFTLVAAGTYLLNDVLDVEADRQHAAKRHRPIAAGAVPIKLALLMSVAFTAAGIVLGVVVAPFLGVVLALYVVLQAAYSLRLKREPVVDIMAISAGFVLRALGGAAATHVPVSGWFLLCLWLLALYLAIEKRKAELRTVPERGSTRAVLRAYSPAWLARVETTVTATALMSYALWAIGRSILLLATVPLVAYGLFKYQLLAEQKDAQAPERIVLGSPQLLITAALWLLMAVTILLLSQQGRLPTRWITW